MPKTKEELFAFPLDWTALLDNQIIENICRPWIAKKMNEYMGAEEPVMINLVVRLLKQRCADRQLYQKVEHILDDAAEDFVEKLWRTLVFEQKKIEAGLYK